MSVPNKIEPYQPGPNVVDITPNQDGGVQKEIIVEGTGRTPPKGCKAFVHYTGSLLDGTVFDSSRNRSSAFDFELGKGAVIKAWDLGVATMKKGEKSMFVCREDYAYGKSGSPPTIPPLATLVFEVELLYWEGKDVSPESDKSIMINVLEEGEEGYYTLNDGSSVDVKITGKFQDQVFESREVSFMMGEGAALGICEGLEIAISKMKKGQISEVEIKSKYAFGNGGKAEFNIPPNADITYEVHLKKCERSKESWDLDMDQKLAESKTFKEKGTHYFKIENYPVALRMYKRAVDHLEYSDDYSEEAKAKKAEITELLLQCRLNIGMVYLKMNKDIEAKEICTKVLEQHPTNEKALFRRGQAHMNMLDYDLAQKDFEEILKVEPNNKAAANQIKMCGLKIKEQLNKEKRLYKNMFEKFASIDKQGS
ncbi:peptidyl-prolyl cis-trans isomerase FKBP4 isoform X2 [Neocloeon triangulifer]|uniref:peptidyl-prolyl cis-trans isomerase FKBP4 isoform X2 n=1 Tax=Neocloeon triangulifer TaxID=2078957 RepID=UPI00286FA515|nr:peptidyl-prolyl cis-trans isomerase FKBP4 isoform X2 [Neocloeon triangulifer]